MSRQQKLAFNGGELSPWLSPRLDLEKYQSGCERLRNCQVIRYGGFRSRPGSLYIAETKDSTKLARLEGLNFSRTESYVLEWGHMYVRFYNAQTGEQIESTPGTPLEIATPYGQTEVMKLQFAQRNDVVVIVHPSHEPRLLSYYADDDWTLEVLPWKRRAYEDANRTTTALSVSAVTGTGLTLTASASAFDSSWVGSYIKLVQNRGESQLNTTHDRVWNPQEYSSDFDGNDQVTNANLAGTNYQVANTPSGNPDRIRYEASPEALKPLFTCIADYAFGTDYDTGVDDPADYPDFFEAGIIAIGPVEVAGGWEFETTGTWAGTWKIERSYDNGTTYEDVKTCTSNSDKNFLVQEAEVADTPALYRVRLMASNSEYTDPNYFRVLARDVEGEVLVTAYTNSTTLTVTVTLDLESTDPTQEWCENSFSARQGYPRAVSFHEERLFFAGTARNPQKLWSSQTGDYYDFTTGTLATDGLALTLNSNKFNGIEWLLSHRAMLIGTTGGEWALTTYQGDPISPENVRAHLQSADGSEALPAHVVNNAAIFVQRAGRKIRELAGAGQEFGGYESVDLTQLAEHVTSGKVLQMAVRTSPDTILDVITGAGELVGMVYERAERVAAWHRWDTAGTYESVATAYGAGEDDELWVIVQRTIDGGTVRYVERFAPDMIRAEEEERQDDLIYLDAAVQVEVASGSTVTGADHLEGETVGVLVGGARVPDVVVSGGEFELPNEVDGATNVVYGLRYTALGRPMPPALSEKTGVSSAWIRFRNTLSAEVSQSEAEGSWRAVDMTQMQATGSPLGVHTGDAKANVPTHWKRGQSLSIRQTEGLPMTVLAVTMDFGVGRD